jgi:DNA-directed RNA polymerase subunit RPC12/RpoP
MAKCPACDHDVRTPYFFNVEGLSRLACPQCKARLEMKPRPVGALFLPIFVACSWLSRLGHTFIAEGLLVAATSILILPLIVRPQVRLRKRPLPKPEIRLNIDGPSN